MLKKKALILLGLVMLICACTPRTPLNGYPPTVVNVSSGSDDAYGSGFEDKLPRGGLWGGGKMGHIIRRHMSLADWLMHNGVQVIRVGDDVRLILPSDRFFYPGSANLNPRYYLVLSDVMNFIRLFEKVDIRVAAYTDDAGDWRHDLALTKLQARVITRTFWRGQIDTRILYGVGYGQEDPIANNATEEGRYQNRRVEVTFRKIVPDVLI